MMKNCLSVIFCAGSLFAAGCGAEGMSTDDFDTIEQELSSTADCDTISPDVTISGGFAPAFSSPSRYSHGRACSRAHLVDVTGFWEDPWHYGNTIANAGSAAGGKSECERHRIGVYAWELLSNGQTEYIGSKWKWGRWTDEDALTHYCDYPSVRPTSEFGLTTAEGRTYRFASSARRYANPKDSRSSFSLRKLHYTNPRRPH